jgi:hypothetical protein
MSKENENKSIMSNPVLSKEEIDYLFTKCGIRPGLNNIYYSTRFHYQKRLIWKEGTTLVDVIENIVKFTEDFQFECGLSQGKLFKKEEIKAKWNDFIRVLE